jgi:hypothetical protein
MGSGLIGRFVPQARAGVGKKLVGRSVAPAVPAAIAIDYPRPGERVTSRAYTFRFSAEPRAAVEVSIDGQGWVPCRPAGGYWWHDWSGYGPGPHHISVRNLSRRRAPSARREFVVDQ